MVGGRGVGNGVNKKFINVTEKLNETKAKMEKEKRL